MVDQLAKGTAPVAATAAAAADQSSASSALGVGVVGKVGDKLSDSLDRSERFRYEIDVQKIVDTTTTESQKYKQSIIEIAGIYHNHNNPTLQ